MPLLLLAALQLGCVPKARHEALLAEHEALLAEHAALQAELEATQAELAATQAALEEAQAPRARRTRPPRSPSPLLDMQAPPPDFDPGRCAPVEPLRFRYEGDPAALRANIGAITTATRFVPHKAADGEIDGYRVSGIREGTLPESCGVKNGDVILTLNGHPLRSMSESTEAYAALAGAPALEVGLLRRTVPLTLRIERPSPEESDAP